jgi:lipopolysaccharide transport system permease protein
MRVTSGRVRPEGTIPKNPGGTVASAVDDIPVEAEIVASVAAATERAFSPAFIRDPECSQTYVPVRPQRAVEWSDGLGEGMAYEIAPPRHRLRGLGTRELWRYRELLVLFAMRDLRLRYRQTIFGVAWALIQPLLAAFVFTFILGHGIGLTGDGVAYSVFVLSGLILWQLFATGVDSAATTLVEQRELITRVWFPRLLAPLGAVLPGLLDLLVGLVALGVLMAFKGVAPGVALVTLPLWALAASLLSFGIGGLLCALNVQFRDVKHTLSFILQLWFFASPIVYASSAVDGAGRWLLAINPLCGVLDGWRWATAGAPAPPHQDLASLATGIVLVTIGLLYFRAVEGRFADVI